MRFWILKLIIILFLFSCKKEQEYNYVQSLDGLANQYENIEINVKNIPLDRILIETDAPWLAPIPFRGKKNEPKYVSEVAKAVAEIKDITLQEVGETTSQNYRNLFL